MTTAWFMALLAAVIMGVILGLLGVGGSIITLPLLVYGAGVPPTEAVGMSLAVVGTTSLTGALVKYRSGLVQVKASILFSVAGVPGALLGSQATHLVSPRILLYLFAGLMLMVSLYMIRRSVKIHAEPTSQEPIRIGGCLMAGVLVGLLTGFLGVGGGILIVPALILFARLPMKVAIGSSLLVIGLNAMAGLVGHLGRVSLPWELTGLFCAMAVGGMMLGSRLTHQIPPRRLQQVFAWFILAVAIFMIGHNLIHAS